MYFLFAHTAEENKHIQISISFKEHYVMATLCDQMNKTQLTSDGLHSELLSLALVI